MYMYIFITNFTKTVTLIVKPTDTIYTIKTIFYNVENMPQQYQHFVYNCKCLKNDKTLEYYNISKDTTIHFRCSFPFEDKNNDIYNNNNDNGNIQTITFDSLEYLYEHSKKEFLLLGAYNAINVIKNNLNTCYINNNDNNNNNIIKWIKLSYFVLKKQPLLLEDLNKNSFYCKVHHQVKNIYITIYNDIYNNIDSVWNKNGTENIKLTINNNTICEHIEWYKNGNLKIICYYTNGQLNGPYNEWYSNGIKKIKCEYKDGQQTDQYNEWNIYGIEKNKHEYDHEYTNNSCMLILL